MKSGIKMELREIFRKIRIIPVSVFENTESALKTAELLAKHRVDVIEVTLRTGSSFDCIEAIKKEFPSITPGAGSVLSRDDLRRASDSGAVFAVAPCLDEDVAAYAAGLKIPFIPGVSTPGELNRALKYSGIIKLFPAHALGGTDYLNSITAPFRMMEFDLIPTGGIDDKNYMEYLECEKVLACGLTYPVAEKLLKKKDYASIEKRIIELYGEI